MSGKEMSNPNVMWTGCCANSKEGGIISHIRPKRRTPDKSLVARTVAVYTSIDSLSCCLELGGTV